MFGFEILTVRSISCRGMMLALLLCHLGCSKLPSQLLDGSSITWFCTAWLAQLPPSWQETLLVHLLCRGIPCGTLWGHKLSLRGRSHVYHWLWS
jgi:hypothetical protein